LIFNILDSLYFYGNTIGNKYYDKIII